MDTFLDNSNNNFEEYLVGGGPPTLKLDYIQLPKQQYQPVEIKNTSPIAPITDDTLLSDEPAKPPSGSPAATSDVGTKGKLVAGTSSEATALSTNTFVDSSNVLNDSTGLITGVDIIKSVTSSENVRDDCLFSPNVLFWIFTIIIIFLLIVGATVYFYRTYRAKENADNVKNNYMNNQMFALSNASSFNSKLTKDFD